MNKLFKGFSVMLIAALMLAGMPMQNVRAAPGSLTGTYSQNFNGLSSASGTLTWTNDLTISGWYSNRTTYLASTGTNNAGSLYSFGTTSGDRALGSIASGTTGTILYGVRLVNDTGGVVNQINVSFTGEQWRSAGSSTAAVSVAQTLDFQYQVGATSLTTGTWVDFGALDFTSPVFGTTAASALDGNLPANRTALSGSITGLTINPGQEVWLRWQDLNDANNDHALAIEDLSITAVAAPVVPNLSINDVSLNEGNSGTTSFDFTVSLSSPAGAGGVTFDIATQDDTATSPSDFTAKSLTGQTIPAGSSTYTFSVLVNGDVVTEADEVFFVNVTNVTGANVLDGQGDGTIINDDAADAAPTVASTFPVNGSTTFPIGDNLTVTFSEPVNVTSSWFTLVCSTSGSVTTAFSGGPTTFTLDPSVVLVGGENCTLTILADQVSDVDANDPPDNMVVNFVVGFTPYDICLDYTPIYSIQGSGLSAAITGTVSTKGVVVGDFEGSAAASGFYIQDLTGDGNPATSDGIFVFTGSSNLVSAGQVVRVTGFARERFNQTTLNGSNSNTSAVPAANIVQCGTGSVAPVDVTLPVSSLDDFEKYEGMYVRFPQSLVIAEYFNYDRFGEMVLALPLAGETRPFTGTAIDEPGALAIARTLANSLSRITLDDIQSAQNPATLRHPNGLPFSLSNRFRGGDLVANAVGVLGFDFSLYRIFPTGPADYTSINPRPVAPDPVGGTVRVAAMNTLNYFITADYPSGNPLDNKCGPLNNVECRGWDFDQPDELTRQRAKLLAALSGLDADVIGLNELENSTGIEPLADIVAGLPGYAYIATGTIGTDAIKVGLIYRPSVVTPIGSFALLTTAVDPRFLDTKSRPVLAQTFEVNATGARFTVAVNHLKSKGSSCDDVGDPDLGDGQGNCSQTRRLAAEALVDWLATDPTASGDPDFIIMGDLNSYAKEDAIDEILEGADDTTGTADDFTNLIAHFQGTYAYSYTFDGQAGYLDHALANASLLPQVTGATEWHINSDEPDILDYDTTFKPPSQDALYEPNAYRSSDHDPVVIGLIPNAPPTVNAGGPYLVNEGGSVTLNATGSDPNGDSLTYAWDLDNNGSFESSGQSVSFSAALLDGPSGPYTVSVRATDPGGLSATSSSTVSVVNVAPAANLSTPSSVNEGNSFGIALTGAFDPSGADTSAGFTYAFDCGSGYGAFGSSNTATCTAVDNPGVTIKGKIQDKDGGVTEYSAAMIINNVAPTLGAITAPLAPVAVNTPINASVNFTDPGVLDTHTVSIDWGNGTTTSGTVSEVNGSGTASGSYTYSTPGIYTIAMTVTDKDGGSSTAMYSFIVVYDPNGGFVTGGGWIDSPAGAYTADPSLTGKATFGFVARYKKGANVPDGNTQFQFKAGDLNFHSTSYDWLVVAGTNAQFKGVGTINGAGLYKFMITADDGNPDKFRIKIWYEVNGVENVVYDNGSQQALGGGSIVIHK